jgi:hypothetical protein
VADNVYFPYEEFFASLLAGVDFAMRDDFAIVFEGGCFGTEGSAAAPGPWRGWLGAVYMKYYWY